MEKILVIQTAFIGDALLTLPMIEKLKENFESSLINVVCIPSTEEIFSASPSVNEVLVLDKKNKHKSIFNLLKFAESIKQRQYTRIYSPHRSLRTSLIVMQSGVRETYGFANSSFFHVYKHLVEYSHTKHEVQRNLDLIGFTYNDEDWKIQPKLKLRESSFNKIQTFLTENNLGEKIIAVAPGSVWETKKYPVKYFADIISYFEDLDYKIILLGGESDKVLCENIAKNFENNVISAGGKFTIVETIELLKKVKLLLTNDSAPTHLGVCADTAVLTIYCSTVPAFGFFPYNKKSFYISYDDLKCKPCGLHGYEKCPINTFDCGYKLEPNIIINKMKEMLSDRN